jgi:hypothetical protein
VLAGQGVLALVLIPFQALIQFYLPHLLEQLQEILLLLVVVMAQCITLPQLVVLVVLVVAALVVLQQVLQDMVALVFLDKEILVEME